MKSAASSTDDKFDDEIGGSFADDTYRKRRKMEGRNQPGGRSQVEKGSKSVEKSRGAWKVDCGLSPLDAALAIEVYALLL